MNKKHEFAQDSSAPAKKRKKRKHNYADDANLDLGGDDGQFGIWGKPTKQELDLMEDSITDAAKGELNEHQLQTREEVRSPFPLASDPLGLQITDLLTPPPPPSLTDRRESKTQGGRQGGRRRNSFRQDGRAKGKKCVNFVSTPLQLKHNTILTRRFAPQPLHSSNSLLLSWTTPRTTTAKGTTTRRRCERGS